MIETIPSDQICMPVTESSQPAAARRAAVALAQDADLDEPAVGNLALVVTELATNLVKHARGGELLMRRLGAEGQEGIEVLSLDKGPGMSDIARSLGDGYSTAGTPGTGLGAVSAQGRCLRSVLPAREGHSGSRTGVRTASDSFAASTIGRSRPAGEIRRSRLWRQLDCSLVRRRVGLRSGGWAGPRSDCVRRRDGDHRRGAPGSDQAFAGRDRGSGPSGGKTHEGRGIRRCGP